MINLYMYKILSLKFSNLKFRDKIREIYILENIKMF